MEWIEFDQQKWADQPLPPARKHLLVQIAAPEHLAVGQSRLDGVAIRCRHLQSGSALDLLHAAQGAKPQHPAQHV